MLKVASLAMRESVVRECVLGAAEDFADEAQERRLDMGAREIVERHFQRLMVRAVEADQELQALGLDHAGGRCRAT